MKKIISIITLVLFKVCLSQSTNYIYEYSRIPDSTQQNKIVKELMVLTISNNKSEFYSVNQFKNDSIIEVSISKGFPAPPQSVTNKNIRILKEIPSNKINFLTSISSTSYNVSQILNLNWKIENEKKEILNYSVQKAVTNYGGRKWIAWFSSDIPIQDGPYKFYNLPGLILKIEDSNQNHIFEIKAIQKTSKNFIYPQNKNISETNISYLQYEKIYKKYRKEPIADIIDRVNDATDSNGNIIPKSQIIREVEASVLKIIKKDNNLIEIDLLK